MQSDEFADPGTSAEDAHGSDNVRIHGVTAPNDSYGPGCLGLGRTAEHIIGEQLAERRERKVVVIHPARCNLSYTPHGVNPWKKCGS